MVLQSRVSVVTLHTASVPVCQQCDTGQRSQYSQYHGSGGGALMGKKTKYGGKKKDDFGGES